MLLALAKITFFFWYICGIAGSVQVLQVKFSKGGFDWGTGHHEDWLDAWFFWPTMFLGAGAAGCEAMIMGLIVNLFWFPLALVCLPLFGPLSFLIAKRMQSWESWRKDKKGQGGD